VAREHFDRRFLDDLIERVDLIELIGESVKLRRGGRSASGLCPFHKESSPSFTVYPSRFFCYGCKKRGDAFDWLKVHEHLEFAEAVERLASLCGVTVPRPATQRPAEDQKRLGMIHSALRQAEGLYQYGLKQDPEALAYLREERGLSDETIAAAGLGVVGRGIAGVLRGRVMDAKSLIWAGLVSVHDTREVEVIRNRLVIPLRNAKGVTIGFAGRSLPNRGLAKPKYLNSPETELFKKSQELYGLNEARTSIAHSRSAVLVEGYFDVLSLRQRGEGRAVAAMGTSLTAEQASRLWRLCDTVTLCMDGDAPGIAAALVAGKTLLSQMSDGKAIRICLLPAEDDPDALVRREGLVGWEAALNRSQPLSDFVVRSLTHDLVDVTPENVVPIVLRAREWLDACAKAPTYRQALAAHFEVRLGISP